MKVLKQYAAQNGFNYAELLNDYMSSTPEEQSQFMMQIGGEAPAPQGGGEEDQIMQLIQMFAQMTGNDPEQIMQQLQQMPPEEQQGAIQQMAQAIQQSQSHGEQEMAQTGGIPTNPNGYYELDPIENPYARIPSGDITMQGIDYPINAYDGNTGQFLEQMQPGQEYQFDTDNVIEEPMYAQQGPKKYPTVIKIEKGIVYLSDGKKLTENQYKEKYADRMKMLNTTKYNTEERREVASVVGSFNELATKQNREREIQDGKGINPLTGKPDPATGYWDRALNYTENNIDPRAQKAEDIINPFSGVSSGGVVNYTKTVLPHLQKKGNQMLTGYYEYPSTTASRYNDLGSTEKLLLDIATDPALLVDFGPSAAKWTGQQVMKHAPTAVKIAKETAILVTKYGSKAAEAILKYGGPAVRYIAQHGLTGLEKAMTFAGKHGDKLGKLSSVKTQLVKLADDEEEDPYKRYLAKAKIESKDNEALSDTLVRNANSFNPDGSLEEVQNKSKSLTALTTSAPSTPSFGGLNYDNIFSNSNTQVPDKGNSSQRSSAPKQRTQSSNVPSYMSQQPFSMQTQYNNRSQEAVPAKGPQKKGATSGTRPSAGGSGRSSHPVAGSKYMPATTNSSSWTGKWMNFLGAQGLIDPERGYNVDEIDDIVYNYVSKNKDIYKNNKYINQGDFEKLLKDGKYGLVHESILPPNDNTAVLPQLGDITQGGFLPSGEINPDEVLSTLPQQSSLFNPQELSGDRLANIPGVDSRATVDGSQNIEENNNAPQYKFAANNLLQNILTGNNLAKAWQPTAPVFRGQSHIIAEQLPEVDFSGAFQQLSDQFKNTIRNVNPNSTVGASIQRDFYGQTLDKMVELSNNAAQQNQQIKAKNMFNQRNAINQQYAQQQQFDAVAYENFLQTSANSDMIKQQALGEAARVYQQQKEDKQMLDMLPMMNPQLVESTSNKDRLSGNRTFQQNPEYVKLYIRSKLEAEEAARIAKAKEEAVKKKK